MLPKHGNVVPCFRITVATTIRTNLRQHLPYGSQDYISGSDLDLFSGNINVNLWLTDNWILLLLWSANGWTPGKQAVSEQRFWI